MKIFKPRIKLLKGTRVVSGVFIGLSLIIAAGVLFAANMYYDIDTGTVKVEDSSEMTGQTVTVNPTGAVSITAGAASTWQTTAGDLTLQAAGDLIASSSENVLLFASGVERMRIASSTGYVGVGTTSPVALLTVEGNAILSGADRYLNFNKATSSAGYGIRDSSGIMQYKDSGGSWTSFISLSGGTGSGAWTTSSSKVYLVDPTETVVIGSNSTTTIGTKFEVIGTSAFDQFTGVYGTTTDFTATSTLHTNLLVAEGTSTLATTTLSMLEAENIDVNDIASIRINNSGDATTSNLYVTGQSHLGTITEGTIGAGLTWSAAQDINNQTFTNVDIDSGAIDGTAIGANSASTGVFSNATSTNMDIVTLLHVIGALSVEGNTTLTTLTASGTSTLATTTVTQLQASGEIIGDSNVLVSGRIGVGTTTPYYDIDVDGSIRATSYYGDGANLTGLPTGGDGTWIFSGNTLYSTTAASYVGIGTTSPGTMLDIYGTTTAQNIIPATSLSFDLGSSGRQWSHLYASSSNFTLLSVSATSSLATTSLTYLEANKVFIWDTATTSKLVVTSGGVIIKGGNLVMSGGNITGVGDITGQGAVTLSSGSGDLTFDAASGNVVVTGSDHLFVGGNIFSTATPAAVRKTGEMIAREIIPIFGFDIPAQTSSTSYTDVSIPIEDYAFTAALADTTRVHKLVIRYADSTTTASSSWRVYNDTDGTEDFSFTVPPSASTSLTQGEAYIKTVTIPTDTDDWHLDVRVGNAMSIRVYQIFLVAYDQVN